MVIGAIALVLVNFLRVTIPLEVRNVVDELQQGFSYAGILRQAGWIVVLTTTMAVIRLISRQLVFGIGRQVEVDLRQRLFCLLYTSPSPRDMRRSRMPSSA